MMTVEDAHLPVTLTIPGISDSEFEALCNRYEHYRVEYSGEGELIVMPPTDPETGSRNADITADLKIWSRANPGGIATDSSAGFMLPNGARYSPDAAWISRARYRQRPCCPEFVIELVSPSDRLSRVRAKMAEWIENGVLLGWMIDPRDRSVTIYRSGRQPEVHRDLDRIEGEGPVAGFVLDLDRIWRPVP